MKKINALVAAVLISSLTGCQVHCQCPKERSYLAAMRILQAPEEHSIIDKIKACDDVDTLRIIVFTARVTAWPMETGQNINFDNKMDGIFQIAMQRLFAIDSDEADESIDCYKRAFPPDGAYSLFFKEWEEERRSLHSRRNGNAKDSQSAIISQQKTQP